MELGQESGAVTEEAQETVTAVITAFEDEKKGDTDTVAEKSATAIKTVEKTVVTDVGSELRSILSGIQAYHGKWNNKGGGANETIIRNFEERWADANKIFTRHKEALSAKLIERYYNTREETEQLLSKPRPRDLKKKKGAA